MSTSALFIKTHLDSNFRAEVLHSLAVAADLVIQGQALTDKEKRTNIGLHVIEAIRFLSKNLANTTGLLADTEEKNVLQMKREDAPQNPLKGFVCTCGAKGDAA